MPILSLQNLIKVYGGRKVVNSVNMAIQSGRVVGLLGPNGAGKTTTFYMAVGMIRPDDGQVMLDQEDVTDCPMYIRARKGIGYLPRKLPFFES